MGGMSIVKKYEVYEREQRGDGEGVCARETGADGTGAVSLI